MGEIKQEADEDGFSPEALRIGVCVGREQRGVRALKWAIEKNFIPPNGHVYFLHVKPPLRWIPNPMGGKLPLDRVNPEMVRRFEEERFLETKKLFKECIKLCEKKMFTHEICYSENDSIQKELVNQISKLRLTKLIFEKSSQNFIIRALGAESISAYVAKNAPDFCTVMVIRNNKLYSISDGSRSNSSLSSSTADQLIATNSFPNEEGGIQSGGQGDQCSASPVRMVQSASMDISRGTSEWMPRCSDDGASLQSNAMIRNLSERPPPRRFTDPGPVTPLHEKPQGTSHFQKRNIDRKHALIGLESKPSVVNASPGQGSLPNVPMEDLGGTANPLVANGRIRGSEYASRSVPSGDCDALSQLSLETEHSTESSTFETLSSQNSLHEVESVQVDSNSAVGSDEVLTALEFDLLQCQLHEAKRSSLLWVEREAERRANNFKMAEEIVVNAKKKIAEYERQRDAALNDARVASRKALYYQKEFEGSAAGVRAALEEQEILQERLAEEVRRHAVTQNELETTRRMAEVKAELAEQECQTARHRCEELKLELEERTEQLERERQLRKEAEERASQEAKAARAAVLTLRKEQNKYSEYSFREIQAATNNLGEENKLGQGGYGPVFKGKLHHTTVAIKVLAREGLRGRTEFQREVELLSRLHHPHLVMLLGACPEKGCIVYEYMANGSLEDRLNCRDNTPPLPWFVRLRICLEVATALLFLHSRPQPVVHRDLKPGNILLDHNFVSKISDVGLAKLVTDNNTFSVTMYKETVLVGTFAYMDPDYQRTGIVSCESDVYSLGIVMLQLLTRQPPVGVAHLVEEAVENGKLKEVLDKSAGEWPLEEAMALARLSLRCVEPRRKHRPTLETDVLPMLESIQKIADIATANLASAGLSSPGRGRIIPGSFFCPISQEIMKNPHIAADGFTYEHDAIKTWLEDHDRSPMTNLLINHKNLVPNHSLRSAIQDWYDSGLLSH